MARVRETVLPHARRGFFAIDLAQAQRDVARLPYSTGSSQTAQLQADCQIDWITLREDKDAQAKDQGK